MHGIYGGAPIARVPLGTLALPVTIVESGGVYTGPLHTVTVRLAVMATRTQHTALAVTSKVSALHVTAR